MTTKDQAAKDKETSETTPLLGRLGGFARRAGVNLTETLGAGYGKGLTSYDKFFYKDVNQSFGDHLEVASRGACFVVICALPFVLPESYCPMCAEVVRLEIYTAVSITYFIYTLYIYTGDILHFAQGGVMGTFLAVLNIWLMQGFMPGGYTETEPHRWTIGVVWGITFVFLILWLNFDDNTKIFGLSTYVWYWMAFIMPDANAGFAQNFQIKMSGKAISEMLVAAAGCSIAILAGYFPYPIYAQRKAMSLCRSMMDQIFMAKQDFLKFYCDSTESDRLKVGVLSREMAALRKEAGSVGALLDSAWYESLGIGPWQSQRVMMFKFAAFIETTVDLLSSAVAVCLDENFDKKHQDLMKEVYPTYLKLIETNGKVLMTCVAILNLGHAPEEMIEHGEAHLAESKTLLKKLSRDFRTKRLALGMNVVGEECSGECVVGLSFSQFTKAIEDFFKKLQGPQQEIRTWRDGGGILGLFEPGVLFDRDHIMWTLRNGISVVLAFFVGWHGYNKYISMYNASLASTVAVLLSKFAGSAMTKNLSRLQGVVIGIVLGNLLYALLGWCYWWGHLLVALALYSWTLMGLFMYFHSEQYSTVGLLLVVFGASALLRPCANTDTDPSGHSLIVNVTVAIVIMTIVDLVFSQARTSDLAINAAKAAVKFQKTNMEMLFGEKEDVPKRKGGMLDKINTAKFLGAEAAQEPRYWRCAWATSRFNQGMECLSKVRSCMMAIETAVLTDKKGAEDQEMKSEMFKLAIGLKSFSGTGGVKEVLLDRYEKIMEVFVDSLGDYGNPDVFVKRVGILTDETEKNFQAYKELEETKDWDVQYNAFSKELADTYKKKGAPKDEPETLKDDDLSEISVFLESLKAMFTALDLVLDAVFA